MAKVSPDGSSLIYSTCLGGNAVFSDTEATGIALDSNGSAYVAGRTNSSDFPTTPSAFQTSRHGVEDAFVTKLSADGSSAVYSTLLGGPGNPSFSRVRFSEASGIAVDSAGSAYVTGQTSTGDFPVTPGAFQTTGAFGGSTMTNVFITKLTADGSSLVCSTYLGDNGGSAMGLAIAADSAKLAYVTGNTSSRSFPVTANSFQSTYGGGSTDAFLTKLTADGSSLVYSSFLGGNSISSLGESGNSIAVDSAGSAYVTGVTDSSNFPVTPAAFQATHGGFPTNTYLDAFVTKIIEFIPVGIDVKPGADPAMINPKSQGKIAVAILSSATFDATTQVDRTSLTFGHTGNEQSLVGCEAQAEDVNGDGLPDVVCRFDTQAAAFQTSDTAGVLKGRTVTGTPIRGSDAITIVGSN